VGLVTPGMVNVRTAPAAKVPAVIVTVNTGGVPAMAAVPAPPLPPAVKVRVPGEATASPDPLSVMTILPVAGIATVGVRDTVMVTPVAPATVPLRVTEGVSGPRVLVTIATKVPVELVSMTVPSFWVVAAAMVVDAA